MEIKQLIHPVQWSADLTADATDSTFTVSAANSVVIEQMRQAYGGSVKMLIIKPPVQSQPGTTYECVNITNVNTGTGICTTDSMTNESKYLLASGTQVYFNLVADGDMEMYGTACWSRAYGYLILTRSGNQRYVYVNSLLNGIVVSGSKPSFAADNCCDTIEYMHMVYSGTGTHGYVYLNSSYNGLVTSTTVPSFATTVVDESKYYFARDNSLVQMTLNSVITGYIVSSVASGTFYNTKSTDSYTGTYSLEQTYSVSGHSFQSISPLTENIDLSYCGAYKLTSGTASGYSDFYFHNGSAGYCPVVTSGNYTGDWNACDGSFTLISGSSGLSLYLEQTNSDFDNMCLCENLITNCSFDRSTTGWTAQNCTLSLSTSYTRFAARSYVYGLKVTPTTGSGHAYQDVTVVNGQWYTFIGYGKGNAADNRFKFQITGNTTNNNYFDSNYDNFTGTSRDYVILERGGVKRYVYINAYLNGLVVSTTKPSFATSDSSTSIEYMHLTISGTDGYIYLNSYYNGLVVSSTIPAFSSTTVATDTYYFKRNGSIAQVTLNTVITGYVISNSLWNNTVNWTRYAKTFRVSGDSSIRIKCMVETVGEAALFDDLSLIPMISMSAYADTPLTLSGSYGYGKDNYNPNGSLLVDGGDTFCIGITSGTDLNPYEGSVNLWYRPMYDYDGFADDAMIISGGGSNPRFIRMYYDKDDYRFYGEFYNGNEFVSSGCYSSVQSFVSGTWLNIGFSYDNGVGTFLYLDGELEGVFSGIGLSKLLQI